jgi:REP element-mobilizing transposase RayT
MPIGEVWEIMSLRLYYLHTVFDVEILAFVLMSNHFHLLLRTPSANLSEAMANFMRETSRAITKAAHRINQTYGQRHSRTIIGSHHYFLQAYKYVYRNPVAAGLCERPENYPYSTLSGLLGANRLIIPVQHDLTLFPDVEGTLDWLARPSNKEDWQSVKRALRRHEFSLAKDRSSKEPNRLEIDSL